MAFIPLPKGVPQEFAGQYQSQLLANLAQASAAYGAAPRGQGMLAALQNGIQQTVRQPLQYQQLARQRDFQDQRNNRANQLLGIQAGNLEAQRANVLAKFREQQAKKEEEQRLREHAANSGDAILMSAAENATFEQLQKLTFQQPEKQSDLEALFADLESSDPAVRARAQRDMARREQLNRSRTPQPEDKAKVEQTKADIKEAGEMLKGIQTNDKMAVDFLRLAEVAKPVLTLNPNSTGFASKQKATIGRAARALGLPSNTAPHEVLDAIGANLSFTELQRLAGAVTDYEGKKAERINLSVGDSAEGNLAKLELGTVFAKQNKEIARRVSRETRGKYGLDRIAAMQGIREEVSQKYRAEVDGIVDKYLTPTDNSTQDKSKPIFGGDKVDAKQAVQEYKNLPDDQKKQFIARNRDVINDSLTAEMLANMPDDELKLLREILGQ